MKQYGVCWIVMLACLLVCTACSKKDTSADASEQADASAAATPGDTDREPGKDNNAEKDEATHHDPHVGVVEGQRAKDANRDARARSREDAQKKRARFIDPEVVRKIQARSGLIQLPPPDVAHLLLRSDLRDVLDYSGSLDTMPLVGTLSNRHYNALRYAMGDRYGCAIQRWTFPDKGALEIRYDDYVDSLHEPVKEPRTDAATYFSTFAGIRMIVMRHTQSLSMIELSCDVSQANENQLRELSERVTSRL